MSPELLIALLAGVVLGASAHRAGLCTVKAVGEMLTTCRAHVLWSFLKASLWTTGILAWAVVLGFTVELGQRPVLASGILGGLIFGLGAGLNGACSFSTLSRLAEGHLVMVFTLVGWAISIAVFQMAYPGLHLPASGHGVPAALALPLSIWMVWEMARIWQRRGAVRAGFQSGFWALSPAALLIARPTEPCWWPGVPGLSRRPRCAAGAGFRSRPVSIRRRCIPGGNDGLVLFGMPALSPHALPSWLAIIGGVMVSLTVMRAAGLRLPKISCDGDVCRSTPERFAWLRVLLSGAGKEDCHADPHHPSC